MINIKGSSYKISNGFFVNEYGIVETAKTNEVKVHEPVNHVFCCDISGSMYGSLSKMRQQLKNRLANIVEDNDTVRRSQIVTHIIVSVLMNDLNESRCPSQ